VTTPRKPKQGPGRHKKWVVVVGRETPGPGSRKPSGSKVALTLAWKAVKA
jgi:hypothetical protein